MVGSCTRVYNADVKITAVKSFKVLATASVSKKCLGLALSSSKTLEILSLPVES
jgi:hypothetical protein